MRSDLQAGVERVTKETHLAESDLRTVCEFLKRADLTVPSDRDHYRELFERHGVGLLVAIEEQLRNVDRKVRKTALDAITPFLSKTEEQGVRDDSAKHLLVLLLIRSMDDRDESNRIRALGKGAGLSEMVSGPQKDHLVTAMVRALNDSSKDVQDMAGFYLTRMGYQDRVPDEIARRIHRKTG